MLTFDPDRACWRLEADQAFTCDIFDPFAENLLLRQRPDCLAALVWTLEEGCILFRTASQGEALDQGLPDGPPLPACGHELLSGILAAVSCARDHLLEIDLRLLRPDLIFRVQGGEDSQLIQIVCLPIRAAEEAREAGSHPLISWLASLYKWPEDMAERIRTLFESGDWTELEDFLDSQRTNKAGEKEETAPAGPVIRQTLRSWFKQLTDFSFFPADRDSVHETTGELDLAGLPLRIAQLSEGLPGTPQEEKGMRAYILTENFLVGRDLARTDLTIDSQAVSRRHARISLKDNHYFLEDLGSKNGTVLDGMRLARHRPCLLPDKCRISFAGHAFYFQAD